ncbi:hypothetical protein HH310_19370 [Actinoplanes sp. TBRC 11911]|nr:hypothetical protein [Actinoplanes sp. TBRC 11911]
MLGVATASAVLATSTVSTQAFSAPPKPGSGGTNAQRHADYDSREFVRVAEAPGPTGRIVPWPSATAVTTLHDQLGVQGIVAIDHATDTPRQVARLDGFLTGPSKKTPVDVALGYIAAHQDVFGLDNAGIAALRLRDDYTDIEGTHHLSFVQEVGGVPVFGNGLKAHVVKDGSLLQIDGAPLKSLPAAAGSPMLSATAAHAKAVADVSGKATATVTRTSSDATRAASFSDSGATSLVYFATAAGPRLAWQTLDLANGYQEVIDATSGDTLYRHDLTQADAADDGSVWADYPGSPRGGTQTTVDLSRWLPPRATTLDGNVAHVYSDVNDDNVANPNEEVQTQGRREFNFPFQSFAKTVGQPCSAAFECSWNSTVPKSWQANRQQNAVQLLNYVGTWHDHLAAAPIGFTRAAGNFEAIDGDALQAQSDDGANTANGLPDAAHADNANMMTPPDGVSPVMQMYLFRSQDGFLAGNGGDEADVVFHEYTHGLSNRLIIDAEGNSTLSGSESQAMGEAWGDWYGLDYLVDQGLERDTATIGDLREGKYLTHGGTVRSEPTDCTVGSPASACPGTPAAGPGGYTYGDFGKIFSGGPEVHADGEIWAQTLWDLRTAVGSTKAESLVTRAMELSPSNPSFLDERNAILAADLVVDNGKLQKTIWSVFAKRGMGYFAASLDGSDSQPVEDFSMPPAPNTPRGTVTGKVTDEDNGKPVDGLTVAFAGHNSGFAGDYAAATTADGTYRIAGVLPGTYGKVFARGAGYDLTTKTLTIKPNATLRTDWQVRKDWAGSSGGASVVSATGTDATAFGCGPGQLIDQSQQSGWSNDATPTGQTVVLHLSGTMNVSELMINPSAVCGDDQTAATAGYRVETSADGTNWTVAAVGTFPNGAATPTPITLAAGTGNAIGFVRYTEVTSQAQAAGQCATDPGQSGCLFVDSAELSVYGTAA